MCDMKNTTEEGKCLDARKDECKWYVDGKCKKKEEGDGKRQIQQDCNTIRQAYRLS